MNVQKSFLPEDYISPRSNASYTRLGNGVTRLRILSSPILGWEDWIDNRPVRYRMHDKPKVWSNPDRKGKHFWSLLVWNYKDEGIQIWHITQGSIRKALEDLSNDPDWREPFFYDVKVNREGEGLKTTYTVNPLPHKTLEDHIQKSFDGTRCNLEALFSGDDPFGLWESYTEGIFDSKKVEEGSKFAYNPNLSCGLSSTFDSDEMDAFLDFQSQNHDRNVLITYIEERSKHFEVTKEETTCQLMQDLPNFEKEFVSWSKHRT